MKATLIRSSLLLLLLALTLLPASAAEKIRLLVVTGGHGFETNQFFKMFQDNPAVSFTAVEHPKAQAWFRADSGQRYDVIVLYDMWQEISSEAKTNLLARLQQGKGLVALHHCLGSYQNWGEYTRIIGGKYHLEKRVVNGVEIPGSTYQHDVRFRVRVTDKNHPVTQGLEDFEILDETYGRLEILPGVHPLLTTEESTSSPTVAWTTSYGQARVVCIQLGHDHFAYENPNFLRLLNQSITWVAPKK